jgi:hypothetical protein
MVRRYLIRYSCKVSYPQRINVVAASIILVNLVGNNPLDEAIDITALLRNSYAGSIMQR